MSETRDAHVAKLKAQLDEWNAEIAGFEAKARQAGAEARLEYQRHLSELRRRYDEANAKLKELQEESEGAWEKLKEGVESSWDALRQGVEKARASFR